MNINIPHFQELKAGEKLRRIRFLFEAIFSIVRKDIGILKPTYSMMIFAFIRISIFILVIGLMIESDYVLAMVLLTFIFIILLIYKNFFYVKRKALQSIMIHQVIVNRDSSMEKARQIYKEVSGRLFLVGLADVLVEKGSNGDPKKRSFLMQMLFMALLEVWDLLKNFMIPVVAIEKKSLKEAVLDLNILRSRIPETLTGVIGIDFVGSFLIGAMFLVYILFLFLGTGIAFLLPLFLDNVTTIPIENFPNLAPIGFLFAIWLIMITSQYIRIIAVSAKTMYFTILYIVLQHPDDIPEDLAPSLIAFLEMRNPANGDKIHSTTTNQSQ